MAIICISRGTKSGGLALAKCLSERLGSAVLGREVLGEAATRLGVSPEALEKRMADGPSLLGRFSAMGRTYVVAVQAALAEHVVSGNVVYHGLAGGLLLAGVPGTLCVRVIAPMDVRVRAVMQESGVDAATAERQIREVDAARTRWIKVMYGQDILDPSLYDLMVNVETITIESACKVIATLAAAPEFEVTPAVRSKLEDFLVACRVRLALVTDPELQVHELDASAERGRVVVSGEIRLDHRSDALSDRITSVAAAVPGVTDVRLQLKEYSPYRGLFGGRG